MKLLFFKISVKPKLLVEICRVFLYSGYAEEHIGGIIK